jgi:membrane dipeptidase
MDQLGIILDVTHLCEETFWNALECFDGHVWASHHNCRALVDDPRQLSDDQIRALAQRNAVIGVALDAWMIVPNWKRGTSNHANLPGADLSALADHVDHIAQMLGTTRHIGIGTDLDGGFGTEQSPSDLDTIADLVKFVAILQRRGYSPDDLEGISHNNFVSLLKRAWTI